MTQTHSTHDAPQWTAALPEALANINSQVLDDAILKKLVDPAVYIIGEVSFEHPTHLKNRFEKETLVRKTQNRVAY